MCLAIPLLVLNSGDDVEFTSAQLAGIPDQILLPACDAVETAHGDTFTITPLSPTETPGLFELVAEQSIIINTDEIILDLIKQVTIVKARWQYKHLVKRLESGETSLGAGSICDDCDIGPNCNPSTREVCLTDFRAEMGLEDLDEEDEL